MTAIRAEAVVEVAAEEPLELWRLRLTNDSDRPRTIELITYQELAIAPWDSYRRTPSYNALHVGTCFVRALGAIIARNRHVKPRKAPRGGYPFAREVAFHAAGRRSPDAARLTGYQDARPCFIGTGTLAAPEVLATGRMRDVADEGLLYSFDPIASLQLRDRAAAARHGRAALRRRLCRRRERGRRRDRAPPRQAPPDPAELAPPFARSRSLDSSLRPPDDSRLPYRFSGGRQGADHHRHDAAALGARAGQPAGPRRRGAERRRDLLLRRQRAAERR